MKNGNLHSVDVLGVGTVGLAMRRPDRRRGWLAVLGEKLEEPLPGWFKSKKTAAGAVRQALTAARARR